MVDVSSQDSGGGETTDPNPNRQTGQPGKQVSRQTTDSNTLFTDVTTLHKGTSPHRAFIVRKGRNASYVTGSETWKWRRAERHAVSGKTYRG